MVTRSEPGGHRSASFGDEEDRSDRGAALIADAVSADLGMAVSACEFPLVVWMPPSGTIRLANQPAAALLELPLSELIGRSVFDLGLPRRSTELVVQAITVDAIENLRSQVEIVLPDGERVHVWAWTRIIGLDGKSGAVTLVTRRSDISRLGRDRLAPWRDLVPIAVGVVDRRWRIVAVSADVAAIVGTSAEEARGRSLLELLHPDDAHRLAADTAGIPLAPSSWCHVRIRAKEGRWTEGCVLTGPSGEVPDRVAFALVGPATGEAASSRRIEELERRLRRIAAEVHAAGVLEDLDSLPSLPELPELAQLSSRQWEIVTRLLAGQRVNAIAQALFISPSTVRNHLSAIFRRFGVHSQSDLLEHLRAPARAEKSRIA